MKLGQNMFNILISDSMDQISKEIFLKNDINVDIKTNLSNIELLNIINNYDGLVVRSATKVTKEIIEAGKKLKVIGRAGAGVDNIDIETAKKNEIVVMNTPGGNTNATAEHTISLIFSLYKNICKANQSTHKGLWEKKIFKNTELKNKKIGLVGFGNVAHRVSQILKSFEMDILVY